MLRFERFTVVFADMPVCFDAGFGPKVTRELAALVIFDDDDLLAELQARIQDCLFDNGLSPAIASKENNQ